MLAISNFGGFSAIGPGTATTASVLSRDIVSNKGGYPITSFHGKVTGFPRVTVNGTPATVISVVNGISGSVTWKAPAAPGITGSVPVVINGKLFTNFDNNQTFPFEYGPAYTTVWGRTGFENSSSTSADGQLSRLTTPSAGSSVNLVDNTVIQPHSGLYCLRQINNNPVNGDNTVVYGGGWVQADMNLPIGRWHRWYVQFTSGTLASISQNGQIKNFLARTSTNNSAVIGFGPEAYDPQQEGVSPAPCYNTIGLIDDVGGSRLSDTFIVTPQNNYGSLPVVTAGVWHEIIVWLYFNWNGRTQSLGALSGSTLGYGRMWWDGKLVSDSTLTGSVNAAPQNLYQMGAGLDTDNRGFQCGLVYTQNGKTYPITEYLDDICVANGMIDPSDV